MSGSMRNRLAKLESGAVDPLTITTDWERRRLAAEAYVRKNIEAVNVFHKMLCPHGPLGEPRDTHVRLETIKDIVAVERCMAEESARITCEELGERWDEFYPAGDAPPAAFYGA